MASITVKFAADSLSGASAHTGCAVLGSGTPGAQAVLLGYGCKQFCQTRNVDKETFLALLSSILYEPDKAEADQ